MANNTSDTPWLIDTANEDVGARPATATVGNAQSLSTKHVTRIDHLVIHAGDGTTDILVVDANGRRVAFVDNPGANNDIWYDVKHSVALPIKVTSAPANFSIEVYFDENP